MLRSVSFETFRPFFTSCRLDRGIIEPDPAVCVPLFLFDPESVSVGFKQNIRT